MTGSRAFATSPSNIGSTIVLTMKWYRTKVPQQSRRASCEKFDKLDEPNPLPANAACRTLFPAYLGFSVRMSA